MSTMITPTIGLAMRGPLSWAFDENLDHSIWDFDSNMELLDEAFAALAERVAFGPINGAIDLGTF